GAVRAALPRQRRARAAADPIQIVPAPRSLRTPTPATVMALACLIGLAGVPAMAQPSAPGLSASWKRIQSPNFVVMGDAAEGDLRSTLRDLEAFRRSMVMLFPYLDTPSPVPTYFVLFKSEN